MADTATSPRGAEAATVSPTQMGRPDGADEPMAVTKSRYILQLEDRLRTVEASLAELVKEREDEEGEDEQDSVKPSITRIQPHRWRLVKKEPGLIRDEGALLVSSHQAALGKHHRLAINSKCLLDLLSNLIGEPITEAENVWVWPFKYLAVYETQIRQAVRDAEAECEREALATTSAQAGTSASTSGGLTPDSSGSEKGATSGATMRRDHLRLLVEFMDEDMRSIFEVRKQIESLTLKTIAFDFLWNLFNPGDIIFTREGRREKAMAQAFLVLHVTGGRTSFDPGHVWRSRSDYLSQDWDENSESEQRNAALARSGSGNKVTVFVIDTVYLDYDGTSVGPKPRRFVITPYPGERRITSLDAYPAVFDPDYAEVMSFLVERGKRFAQLADGSHQWYSGTTLKETKGRKGRTYQYFEVNPEEIESEVMVDQASAIAHFQSEFSPYEFTFGSGILAAPTGSDRGEVFDRLPEKSGDSWITDIHDDSVVDIDRRSEFLSKTDIMSLRRIDDPDMTDLHFRLLPPRIYSYAMLQRRWFPLKVANLTDVGDEMTGAHGPRTRFDDLVLPSGHKKLLQALVKHYTDKQEEKENRSMDIVYGKGGGLIILLHGAPGVGKTSTAECVAAQLRRPLLPITCGDLWGFRGARDMETALEKFCNLAHKWRCVLLLDEADVFLSKREKGETNRNSFVAVFLRVLEYYSGVLVLTSNRVGELDEAFRSRIHICLFYPKLEKASAEKIWENNMTRIKTSGATMNLDVDEDDLRRFRALLWTENERRGLPQWNGRQIRNAFQTAIALAHFDYAKSREGARPARPKLRAKHFRRVEETTAEFDRYIAGLYGLDEMDAYSVLAARDEVRRDSAPVGAKELKAPGASRGKGSRRPAGMRRDALFESSSEFDSDADASEEGESDYDAVELEKLVRKLAKMKQKESRKG